MDSDIMQIYALFFNSFVTTFMIECSCEVTANYYQLLSNHILLTKWTEFFTTATLIPSGLFHFLVARKRQSLWFG